DLALPVAAEFLAQWDPAETVASEEVFNDEAPPLTHGRIDTSEMFRASFRKWRQWSVAGTMAAAFLAVVTLSVVRQRSVPVPLFQPPVVTSAEAVATLRRAADVQWVNVTNEMFQGD